MADLKSLLLRAPARTLSVAESLTCGRLQAKIGAISGASGFFAGGITAYTLDQKVRHLGVDREKAASVNCVSAGIAEQMARGAVAMFGSDFSAATTGYAEPAPGLGISEAYAFWAVAWTLPGGGCGVRSGRIDCPGAGRLEVQQQVADAAYAQILLIIAERRSGEPAR